MVIVEGYSLINGIPLYDSSLDGMQICSICDYSGWGIIMKKDNEGKRIDISRIFTSINKEVKLPATEYKFAPKVMGKWENILFCFFIFLIIVTILFPSVLCLIEILH